jgi:hypothetical protein
MRRRKPSKPHEAVQVNLRLNEGLRLQLERAAEEHHVTFSQEVRARLVDSFDPAEQSLAGFLTRFKRDLRDRIESNPRNAHDIERHWRHVNNVDASIARLYTAVEEALLEDLRDDPKIRELVRGAPSGTKSTQKKREDGGKS